MTLREKINKLSNYYKQIYFRWKYGLISRERDYSKYTEEEVIENFFKGDRKKFESMKLWEGTDEYADLVLTLLKERIHNDIIEVYNVVLEKARTGDEKAVRTLLLLQKEIRSSIKRKDVLQNDDDLIV